MPADDRRLSVDEIAEHFGVSEDTVYGWLTGKRMPGHRIGRFWKFKKDEIDEWVRAGGAAAKAADDEDTPAGDDGSEGP